MAMWNKTSICQLPLQQETDIRCKFWPTECDQKWYMRPLGYTLKEKGDDIPLSPLPVDRNVVVALMGPLGLCRRKCHPRAGGGVNKVEGAGPLALGAAIVVLEYFMLLMIWECQEKLKEFEMSNYNIHRCPEGLAQPADLYQLCPWTVSQLRKLRQLREVQMSLSFPRANKFCPVEYNDPPLLCSRTPASWKKPVLHLFLNSFQHSSLAYISVILWILHWTGSNILLACSLVNELQSLESIFFILVWELRFYLLLKIIL